jgi:hypothetical protein
MQNTYPVSTICKEETSDPLSMEDSNFNLYSLDEDSTSSYSSDGVSSQSKKIIKRRTAYQKIDDDVRLELLNAVQKRGETLKSASKRLGINYSSAKSVLHTFRKEGRILKKTVLERALPTPSASISGHKTSSVPTRPQVITRNLNIQPRIPLEGFRPLNLQKVSHVASPSNSSTRSGYGSPLNGVAQNFGHMLLNAVHLKEDSNTPKSQMPGLTLSKSKFSVSTNDPSPNNIHIHLQQRAMPSFNVMASKSPKSPLDILRNLDNFYLNYSNSPLSGGAAKLLGAFSDSGSHKTFPNEFDSFSEMVSHLQSGQNQPCHMETLKNERYIPKPMAFNAPGFLHNRYDASFVNEDGTANWFRGLVETQQLLTDTIQTASYLNTLMYAQKASSGMSPTNMWGKY